MLPANIAFIDGQNLHLGTKEAGWAVDHRKLRIYLQEKYSIGKVYYFLGFPVEGYGALYDSLQRAGFVLLFKEHSSILRGSKKGNVDCDIVFEAMKSLVENEHTGDVYIISGDGDYKKLIDYLITKDCFGKILFPNRSFASSLYKSLNRRFFDSLDTKELKEKIAYAI